MNFIKNLKIATKLFGSFFMMIGAMMAIGVISIANMGTLKDSIDNIYQDNYMSTMYILEAKANINFISTYTNRIVNDDNAHLYAENLKFIQDALALNAELMAKYEALLDPGDLKAIRLFSECERLYNDYVDEQRLIISLAGTGDYEEASYENAEVLTPMIRTLRSKLEELVNYDKETAEKRMSEAHNIYNQSLTYTVSIIATMAFVAAVLAFMISSLIVGAFKSANYVTDKIAGGDLTVQVPELYRLQKDEVGHLARNIQAMRDSLYETVRGIKSATGILDSSVTDTKITLDKLNDRISDTSAATEELSAGMEETGASAEEMSATATEIERAVESVANKAEEGALKSNEIHHRASKLGKDVSDSIDKSNKIFNEIKLALTKALEDSKAVDEINSLADAILGITSQTTLLALNASIEAARAGEAGRGFAVVANEISYLADNSKNTVTKIQAITKIVMSAVNALSSSSTNLLNFVSEEVLQDYQEMLAAADSYDNDAMYMSDMTTDLSSTAEQLLASIQMMMRAISEVSSATQEGARTTSLVAEQTTDISAKTQVIVTNMKEAHDTSNQLVHLVDRFIL